MQIEQTKKDIMIFLNQKHICWTTVYYNILNSKLFYFI